MTKKQYSLLILILILIICVMYYLVPPAERHGPTPQRTEHPPVESREVIGSDRRPIQTPPDKVVLLNRPSAQWRKKLVESMRQQSRSVKNIDVKTERSLTWLRDGNAIAVESVVVTLTNQRDEESSFRALVDSQTGKVLETWDQSITDPLNSRDGLKLRPDPRYFD